MPCYIAYKKKRRGKIARQSSRRTGPKEAGRDMHDIYGIDSWGDQLLTIMDNGHLGLCQPGQPGCRAS